MWGKHFNKQKRMMFKFAGFFLFPLHVTFMFFTDTPTIIARAFLGLHVPLFSIDFLSILASLVFHSSFLSHPI